MTESAPKKRITHPERILTLANLISVLRAFMAFPIIYTLKRPEWLVYTIVLVVIAVLSDALDGFFARRAHEVTHIGKIIDPLADAAVIISVTFFMVLDSSRGLPVWYLILFMIRYLAITLFALYLMNHTKHEFCANKLGKVSVFVTAMTLFLYILNLPVLEPLKIVVLAISIVFLLASLFSYMREYYQVFKTIS